MLGVGIIGAGRIAKVHARTVTDSGARVAAIYDIIKPAATALAEQYQATPSSSVQELIEDPKVDIVLIASPSPFHVEQILAAVRAGKRVLCEKPLAPDFEGARYCVDQLGDKAKDVFIGFNRRFDVGHSEFNRRLRDGTVGTLTQLIITSRDPIPPPIEYAKTSGGLYRDMMIHDFDMAQWMLGDDPVMEVYAQGQCLVHKEFAEFDDVDTAAVSLRTAAGTIAVILNARYANYAYDQRIEALGTQGMLLSDNPRGTGVRHYSNDRFDNQDPYPGFFLERYQAAYQAEMEAFLECIATGAPIPISAIDGMRANYLAEAATASSQRGVAIKLTADYKVTW